MKHFLSAVIIALAAPAVAQNGPDYDPTILTSCMTDVVNSTQGFGCIGRAAYACTMTDAGQSTMGYGFCYAEEWQQWDEHLNTSYQALLMQQTVLAADLAEYNENMPDAVELLQKMQRHWIAYRDAMCDWEYVQWAGGTGASPASAECMMRLTALQTLFLNDHL